MKTTQGYSSVKAKYYLTPLGCRAGSKSTLRQCGVNFKTQDGAPSLSKIALGQRSKPIDLWLFFADFT